MGINRRPTEMRTTPGARQLIRGLCQIPRLGGQAMLLQQNTKREVGGDSKDFLEISAAMK